MPPQPQPRPPRSYTAFWTNGLCRELAREGYGGLRPTILFGGPYTSMPGFVRAGVRPGDRIHPVRVHRAELHVLGTMEVARIVPYEDAGSVLADEDYAKLLFWRSLKTNSVTEVLLGPPGAPLTFDNPVPRTVLERLTYTSDRRGDRGVKFLAEGRLTRPHSVQGIYRLAPHSAADLDALVRDRHRRPDAAARQAAGVYLRPGPGCTQAASPAARRFVAYGHADHRQVP
ncbi:hypothetical protein ACFYVL_04085 [Streptomyces sp. NPDC004111]|uniref:hypothetical protein n=1 Tax=Streptomyces sp. NPDC004111 TaxID=3364690 RepID=UPI0036784C87